MFDADQLRSTVRGRVVVAGESGFDDARRPWNIAVDQRVAAVVHAVDTSDVVATVRFAKAAGLAIAAQPSGHGATGHVDGVILLRTALLDDVEVRPETRTARVGAGASSGKLQAAASKHGLTGLPGSSPVVSVVGYLLGGGLSWFGRRHGWAAESVRSFEVVDAEGVQRHVSAQTDAELFWALKGGGGDYALVTSVEVDLYPAPELYGGRMIWPADQARRVMQAYRQIAAEAPEELTVWLDLLAFPGSAPMVAVDSTYLGSAAEGRSMLLRLEAIDGILSDTRGAMSVADIGDITGEPTEPGAGASRGVILTELSEDVVSALLDEPIDPLLTVQVRHLGGQLARPASGAAAPLTEPFALYLFGLAPTPEATRLVRARQDQMIARLAPYLGPRKPYTYLAPGETAESAFTAETLRRLREIKVRRDPADLFRSNYPVNAGRSAGADA